MDEHGSFEDEDGSVKTGNSVILILKIFRVSTIVTSNLLFQGM